MRSKGGLRFDEAITRRTTTILLWDGGPWLAAPVKRSDGVVIFGNVLV